MSGSTPHYPPYSPTHQSHPPFYNHDTYNNASHNYPKPSQYPPSPIRPPVGTPLPAPSPSSLPHNAAAPYQPLTSSPPYSSQRPFASQQNPTTMANPYEGTTAAHAHPPVRPPTMLQSPIREYAPLSNGISREAHVQETRPQSQGVSNRIIDSSLTMLTSLEIRSCQQSHVFC